MATAGLHGVAQAVFLDLDGDRLWCTDALHALASSHFLVLQHHETAARVPLTQKLTNVLHLEEGAQDVDLGYERVAEAVEDQAWEAIAFTMDDPVGIGDLGQVQDLFAQLEGFRKGCEEMSLWVFNRQPAEQPKREVGARIVETAADQPLVLVADVHDASRRNGLLGLADHLAEEPRMAAANANLQLDRWERHDTRMSDLAMRRNVGDLRSEKSRAESARAMVGVPATERCGVCGFGRGAILLSDSPLLPMLAIQAPCSVQAAEHERRATDRRARSTPMFSRYTFAGGRRQHVRRLEDDQEIFVDRYGAGLLFAVLAVVLLNLADAYFTLLFLAHGGQELNPLVDQVLAYGPQAFILFKTIGMGVCAAFLTITKNFRAARIGLWVVLVGYSLLLCWHLLLLATMFF